MCQPCLLFELVEVQENERENKGRPTNRVGLVVVVVVVVVIISKTRNSLVTVVSVYVESWNAKRLKKKEEEEEEEVVGK